LLKFQASPDQLPALAPLFGAYPPSVNSSCGWSDSELALLGWADAIDVSMSMRMFLQRVHLELWPLLQQELAASQGDFSLQAFRTACAVVMSRGMALPGCQGTMLVPVADMANYAPGHCNTAMQLGDSSALELVLTQEVAAGEEILLGALCPGCAA